MFGTILLFVCFILIGAWISSKNKGKMLRSMNNSRKKTKAEKRAANSGSPETEKSITQRLASLTDPDQWRAAKEQQDDVEHLHAVNVDSCESKLESLKTLYDAGILSREEYDQRVAKTKARHAHGTGEQ